VGNRRPASLDEGDFGRFSLLYYFIYLRFTDGFSAQKEKIRRFVGRTLIIKAQIYPVAHASGSAFCNTLKK
jgi:hypothetical protein